MRNLLGGTRLTGTRLVLTLMSGFLAAPSTAMAENVSVPMDQVRLITFRSPVQTVYVGNPLIADITIVDSTRVFVMGKNFGTTNLVALDEYGEQVTNDRITVLGRSGSIVTVQRGAAQTTLDCVGGRCQAAPVPGDAVDPFAAVNEQMSLRESGIIAAAGNAGG